MIKEGKRVLIGTPMYGGQCYGAYTQALLSLQKLFISKGHTLELMYTSNESLIVQARNEIVHVFMRDNFDYLLFIDGDHRFDPPGILKMLEEDDDVICGICPRKLINWKTVAEASRMGATNLEFFTGKFAVEPLENTFFKIDEKFEIKRGGTGIMLIKRQVFDKMRPNQKEYRSNYGSHSTVEYFKTYVKDGELISEDYGFCEEWRSLGGKIYAAPWVEATHVGVYEFKGTLKAVVDLEDRKNRIKR